MMIISFVLLAVVVAVVVSAQQQQQQDKCRVWLAPSTKSDFKLGLFTGVDLDENVTITNEIVIPLHDFEINRRDDKFFESSKWNEGDGPSYNVKSFVGDLDGNVQWQQDDHLAAQMFHAGHDAHESSRGSISTLVKQLVTTHPYKAGTEIGFGSSELYKEADLYLHQMVQFMTKYQDTLSIQHRNDILEFLLELMGIGNKTRAIRDLLPKSGGKLKAVHKMGTYEYKNPAKTPQWLKEHGTCMDTLKMTSSSPYGQGLVANRAISKDQLILVAPMVTIRSSRLEMSKSTQLAINYCFGHAQSSMVFMPVGGMVSAINHNPNPNAKLEWSSINPERVRQKALKEHDVVVFNVVAIKDIGSGDEILIDYGPEWTKAWNEHQASWDSKQKWPLKAADLKEQGMEFPTKDDAKQQLPDGIGTACLLEDSSKYEPCDLLQKQKEGTYTVTVNRKMVRNVEPTSIMYVDKPYQSDAFVAGAFRHVIGLPDDLLFPDKWRNRP